MRMDMDGAISKVPIDGIERLIHENGHGWSYI